MKSFNVPVNPLIVPIREAFIKEILGRGNVARFTMDGWFKDVNEWNLDLEGDLKAFRKSPEFRTDYVCWASERYEISEISQ